MSRLDTAAFFQFLFVSFIISTSPVSVFRTRCLFLSDLFLHFFLELPFPGPGLDELVEDQQEGRQNEDYAGHGKHGASGHQLAQRADHVDVRIQTDAEGRREEAQRADQNGLAAGLRGNRQGRILVLAGLPFKQIPVGHQNRIVHAGSQLHRRDDDAGDEGQRGAGVIADAHVDEDGQLNDADQDDRDRYGSEDQHDDEEDDADGRRIHSREVLVRDLNQILGAGRFADQHRPGVIALGDALQFADLAVDLIGRDLVFGADQDQLPVVIDGLLLQAVGNGGIRNRIALDRIQADDVVDAVHILHLLGHRLDVLGRDVAVDHQHVDRIHLEGVIQLLVGDDAVHGLGQRAVQVVVDLVVAVAVEGRHHQDDEADQKRLVVLDDERTESADIRQQRLVHRLLQRLVQHQDHGRQGRDAADQSEQDALGHDNAHVHAQPEAHEAQGDEAGDGRRGGTQHGAEGQFDGLGHGVLRILAGIAPFHVAVPQEDGIVHCHAQLQHRRNRLGDVGNGTQEHVGAQVVDDGLADAGQEDERNQIAVHGEGQGDGGKHHRQLHIDRRFLVSQILSVDDDRRRAGQEALLVGQLADVRHRLHRVVRRGCVVVDDQHQRRIALVEGVINLVRKHFLRHADVRQRVIPDHRLHMVDAFDLRLQLDDILVRHAFHQQGGKSAAAEFVLQNVLALHRVNAFRQIAQHVIVHLGVNIHDIGRNRQQQGQDDDQNTVFDYPV